MKIDTFKPWAQSLVEFFYPLVEASLFGPEGKLIEIINPFSSLKEDQELELEKQGKTSHIVLASGTKVKQMVRPIGNDGFLRLRYNTSPLHHLKDQLELLLGSSSAQTNTADVNEWQTHVDQLIAQYLKEHRITLHVAMPKQKREIIALLHGKRLFEFKESSAYIAAKIEMSRATIYNYLKTISSFQKVQVHQVDAFTDKKFGGNPAGVVLDADTLDETLMRKITRELNLSETAFVLPSKKGDFRLRYFTPTGHEINFCGHSTVGSLFVLAREKRLPIGSYTAETLSGLLQMQIIGDTQVSYEPPQARLHPSEISYETIAKIIGLDVELTNQKIPVMYDATSKTLFITLKSLEALGKIQCDFKALTALSKQHDLIVLCCLTQETFDTKSQIHMRCFAPLVGINEDPFTGSVLGGLTIYADRFHLLPPKTHQFRVEQGHFLDRPGSVEVEFSNRSSVYHTKVLAQAVHCFSTEINLT